MVNDLFLGGSGGAGRGRRPLEINTAVVAVVVVPSIADARHIEPSDEDEVLPGKLMLAKLEVDDKAGTVPLKLQRTNLAIGKSTDRIACGPQSREGRSEINERVDVVCQLSRVNLRATYFLKAMLRTGTEPWRAAGRDLGRDKVST